MTTDPTRSKALEVMAMAICGKNCDAPRCSCQTNKTTQRACWEISLRGAEAALTAYESHLQASGMAVVPGWQPIESAPKDGSEILGCYFKDWGDGNVSRYGPWTIAWNGRDWRSSWDGTQVIEYMCDFGTEYKEPDLKPNFWMPLPPASPYGKAVVKEKDDPTRLSGWDADRCRRLMPSFYEAWRQCEAYRLLADLAAEAGR